jgi:hypothetical protein
MMPSSATVEGRVSRAEDIPAPTECFGADHGPLRT